MNRLRMCSSVATFSLAILFPFCANATPADPCRQLQRDLDRQIDSLKESQKNDLQSCHNTSGRDSAECRMLQDQQNLELSSRRADRAGSMAACGVTVKLDLLAVPIHGAGDFTTTYYDYRNECEYPKVSCPPPNNFIGRPVYHPPHHEPGLRARGAATASNGRSGGGRTSSSGSSGVHSGGSSTHSGYTGSSGGGSGSGSSSGGSSSGSYHGGGFGGSSGSSGGSGGGSVGGGGSSGGGSHDGGGGGGGRHSN